MMSILALPLLRVFTLLFVCLFPISVNALPAHSNVPGGIAIVRLPMSLQAESQPKAWFQNRPVWVARQNDQWVALVGLGLDLPVGTHTLQVGGKARENVSFEVVEKRYPEQHITLKDTRRVDLSADDQARAAKESAKIGEIKLVWREMESATQYYTLPVEGRISGRFGVRRFFNGKPRAPHSGLDIAAPLGAPVKAMDKGIVIDVGDYFFNGKTVFIDHGNGLISMSCHLDHYTVQTGEQIKQGQVIGLVGKTGRASGPHLHLSVILNGVTVDPALFLPRVQAGGKRKK